MTLKGTSSLQRTTYFHLYFHDSMLIFQKQLIWISDDSLTFIILEDPAPPQRGLFEGG